MNIDVIGLWATRIALVIGAIVCGCLGKEEIAGLCIIALVVSFFFLDRD